MVAMPGGVEPHGLILEVAPAGSYRLCKTMAERHHGFPPAFLVDSLISISPAPARLRHIAPGDSALLALDAAKPKTHFRTLSRGLRR
jgi:hypothetical protein